MKWIKNNKENTVFYIYAYLDIRKQNDYVYFDDKLNLELKFDYEPFYIGKGQNNRYLKHLTENLQTTCNTHKVGKIKKIFQETNQNPKIIFLNSNLTAKKALMLEKTYIKLIGRSDLKKGPLTNQTDGGDGPINRVVSEQHRKNLSIANSGRKISYDTKKQRELNPQKTSKKIIQYDINFNIINIYKSTEEASRNTNINRRGIKKTCIGQRNTAGGYVWRYFNDGPILFKKEKKIKKWPVLQYDLNLNIVKEYDSPLQVQKVTGLKKNNIIACCNNRQKTAYNYIWKYKKDVIQITHKHLN